MVRTAILMTGVMAMTSAAGLLATRGQVTPTTPTTTTPSTTKPQTTTPATATGGEQTTNDGVYTAEQAVAGKALYREVCESCHQPAKFTGSEFVRAYVKRPLSNIDAAMVDMPMDNPGSLSREQIASLIAYFLEMNEYPAGKTPLDGKADALKAIMVAPRPEATPPGR